MIYDDNLTHTTVSAGLPSVSRGTDAHVCTNQVLAGHASAGTVIYTIFTLILVWKTNSILRVRACIRRNKHMCTVCKHVQQLNQ